MKKSMSRILALLLMPTLLVADDQPVMPQALDLETAKELAIEHSPFLKQVKEGLSLQSGKLRELQSSRRPQLELASTYTRYDKTRQGSFGSGAAPDSERWDALAEASIAVYAGGRNKRAVMAEEGRRDAVAADLEASVQDLLAEVCETYYDAQLAQETVRVQQQSIELLEEQLKYAQNRLDAGVGARFEVIQAAVSLSNARPPLIRAENDYRRKIDDLRRILGLTFAVGTDASDVAVGSVRPPAIEDLDLEGALEAARESRIEFEEAAKRIEAAHEDVKVASRQRSPVVRLFANYGAENDQFADEILDGWAAGVRLNWDVWDGGESSGKILQRAAELRRLEYERDELALAIASEVRQAFYDHEEARSILESSARVVDQADEALRLARNRHEAGKGTQLEVLESQLQLTQARLEDSQALNSYQRAMVRIRRAMGAPLN